MLHRTITRLFTIHFPELDHVPLEKRDEMLRRCAKSAEMTLFRSRLRFIGFMPVLVAFPLFFAALFLWQWNFLTALGLFLATLFASIICMFGLIIGLRTRMYRKLVRAELQEYDTA
jgi:hypothetical protein